MPNDRIIAASPESIAYVTAISGMPAAFYA
jgi:hypothetical protein